MGVPGFFAWLLKNNTHNNIILNQLDNINCLYFDANCLFHPKCFDVLKLHSNITDIEKLEKLMIERIIKYIEYIINFTKPSNLVYIAVDGVAPIAKINQQRKRRYKSVIDKEYQHELNKKYNIIKNDIWSNIVITPGTDFMIRLDNQLEKFIKTFQKNNQNLNIIYSSYKECGEGEHKIMRYIKNDLINNNSNKNHVIYGLDADLIFLAMSYEKSENIFLLRELNHIKNITQPITEEVNEKLCYVSIKNTINTYNEIIKSKLEENLDIMEVNLNEYDFSKDFIILCFMLGNDFLPHIPSLNIRNNGIEYLIDAYVYMFTFTKSYIYSQLNNNSQLNNSNLLFILSYLKDIESEYFELDLPKYKQKFRHKKFMKSANSTNEDYERELWEHDNMINNKSDDDYVKLGINHKAEYKFRYYEHHFHSRINQQRFINKVCHNYFMMINWITKYYFEINMPSWRYCYQFDESPFVSDLYVYLNDFLSEGKQFESILYEDSIKIETQLLSVIPPQFYKNIFNKNIENEYIKKLNDVRTKYMFPQKPHIEFNKDVYWLCEPLLPTIDIELLLS